LFIVLVDISDPRITDIPTNILVYSQCAGFTYRLDRLKPRVSKFRGPPAKVYNIFPRDDKRYDMKMPCNNLYISTRRIITVPDLDKERP
jgi:hypothetical protein